MAKLPGLYFLKAYPQEEIWRLFVDGRFWLKEKGWQGYESREPGSLNAVLESLCSSALEVEEDFELNPDFIKSIHKKCGKQVQMMADKSPGETRTKEPVSFGIPANRASIQGIEEFLRLPFLNEGGGIFGPATDGLMGPIFEFDYFQDLQAEEIPELAQKIYADMKESGYSQSSHFFLAVRKHVDDYLEQICHSYNQEIRTAESLDEKLLVIAKHIRQFEVLHPFKDANGRTFANNLLNILLMQQGLPPATFYEPNVFDLYSAEELVVVIKEGIFNTLELIEKNQNELSLYGYTASVEERNQFVALLDSPAYSRIQAINYPDSAIVQLRESAAGCIASLAQQYPLHRGAVYLGDANEIGQLVLANIAQINEPVGQGAPPLYVGKTALHVAVMLRNFAMVDALVAQAADLSIQDYEGKTALHYAAESGNVQLMLRILNATLQRHDAMEILNLKDSQGRTAFHYAAGVDNPEIVTSLTTTNFVQLDEVDKEGSSALTIAYKAGKMRSFDRLLAANAEISKELLEKIVNKGDEATFSRVLELNPKILGDNYAFYLALKLGKLNLVEKFLQAGMDINRTFTTGNLTALMIAANGGSSELLCHLLYNGADTSLLDANGGTCLHSALNSANKLEMASMLVAADPSLLERRGSSRPSPIYLAALVNDSDLIKLFLARGADPTYVDDSGNNILHAAMKHSDLSLISDLANREPSLLHATNNEGRHPFQQRLFESSTYRGKGNSEDQLLELSQLLLAGDVDLNNKDRGSRTILEEALAKNYCRLSLRLIKAGAQVGLASPRQCLKEAEANQILGSTADFKERLGGQLAKNPLVAMTQLNELYLQVKKNQLKIPQGYTPGKSFFHKGNSNDQKAHDKVLSVLKQLYDRKLHELLDKHYGSNKERVAEKTGFFKENLKPLIHSQELSRKIERPPAQVVDGEAYRISWK